MVFSSIELEKKISTFVFTMLVMDFVGQGPELFSSISCFTQVFKHHKYHTCVCLLLTLESR